MTHNILIVDDTPTNIHLLAEMLSKNGYEVRPTTSGEHALQAIESAVPDLILLDIVMPDMDGFEVCQRIKAQPHLDDVPVMFISALDDVDEKVKAFQVGGVDYITKPFKSAEVLARVRTHLALRDQQRELAALRQNEREHFEQIVALKDDVLRMVSHDLKNPLSSVTVALSYIGDIVHSEVSDDAQETAFYYLDVIKHGIDKMRQLITDVLDLASAEQNIEMHREAVPLSQYLAYCVSEMHIAAQEQDISLQIVAPQQDGNISVSLNRFEHVMNNLISNAIKYNQPGGVVELGGSVDEKRAILWVRDDGIGIPADDLPHIFNKFYRVEGSAEHRKRSGTGLGMAIAKAIVDQHGGTLSVESVLGKGTTFTIVLPRL